MTLKTVAVAVLLFAREIMAKDEVKMNLLLSAFGPLVLSIEVFKKLRKILFTEIRYIFALHGKLILQKCFRSQTERDWLTHNSNVRLL